MTKLSAQYTKNYLNHGFYGDVFFLQKLPQRFLNWSDGTHYILNLSHEFCSPEFCMGSYNGLELEAD